MPYEFHLKRARSFLLVPVWLMLGTLLLLIAAAPEATCAFIQKPASCFDRAFVPNALRTAFCLLMGLFFLGLAPLRTIDLVKGRTLKITNAGISGFHPLGGPWFIPWHTITSIKTVSQFLNIRTTKAAQATRWHRISKGGYVFVIYLADFDLKGVDLASAIRQQRPDL